MIFILIDQPTILTTKNNCEGGIRKFTLVVRMKQTHQKLRNLIRVVDMGVEVLGDNWSGQVVVGLEPNE